MEEIQEAQATKSSGIAPDLVKGCFRQRVIMAMRLLTLAIIEEN